MLKVQDAHVHVVGHGPMPYVKLDNKWYSLDGWDGEIYQCCSERESGEILSGFVGNTVYKLKPIIENGKTVGYEFV